ncbi:MAG: 12-oxophytodienoate reductase [Sphingobium sp.]|nr:12-oxophytodienoate reductase [Sphingobium sp.]
MNQSLLFTPLQVGNIILPNRFVMPAMQRGYCADGRPLEALADYYRRRAEGGVALIIGESCAIDHPSATRQPAAARMNPATRDGWARCVEEVHAAGGRMLIQLWHEGALRNADDGRTISPSGLVRPGQQNGRAASLAELAELREAYLMAALDAQAIGAEGVEIHSAHGYLLDQFLWSATNLRDDGYGGEQIADRARLHAEIVSSIRAACGPEFLISVRFSQWKEVDYAAKIARTPAELEVFVRTLERAGVDLFHASTRRFWEPEWIGDPRGLAGWVKSFSTVPVIAVGSVGLDIDIMTTFIEQADPKLQVPEAMDELEKRVAGGEFDLVAVGRALIGDPDFVHKVRENRMNEIRPFSRSDLGQLEWDSSIVEEAHDVQP